MIPGDPLERVLHIDLAKRSFRVERRPDIFGKYLGGAGVAIALLSENCPPGCDPLGPDNPIVLAVGPLTGLYPLASKTVAMFKSPHTGNLGESHCGGRSAVSIRMAGYGAMVITGKSDIPVYLAVHGDRVSFRDATTFWGMSSNYTAGKIIREREPFAGLRSIMRIGRAGENMVSYACVSTETYRHFGRLGLGAVFGSKKLKALVVSGKRSLPVSDRKEYRTLYEEIYRAAVSSDLMKKYHDLGTAGNVRSLNALGGLPTRNLKEARFPDAEGITGEALAEHYLGRRLACAHCPVGCIHTGALREPYEDEAYFYKTSMISYDYELIYSLGSQLGISDPQGLFRLMDHVESLGLDAMSTGVVLAWATEALEKGLVSNKDTLDVPLAFGDPEPYIRAMGRIVERSNMFYDSLAKGLDRAVELYGGKEFALTFAGNEMPGYHTGPAAHIGVLIGARHGHLDNGGYGIDQKEMVRKRMSPEALVDALMEEEQWRQIMSSLVTCFFARGIYTPEVTARALGTVGVDADPDRLDRIGEEIYLEKYGFKFREGFTFQGLKAPGRVYSTPTPLGILDEGYIDRALAYAERILKSALIGRMKKAEDKIIKGGI